MRVAGLQVVTFCRGTRVHIYEYPRVTDDQETNEIPEEEEEEVRRSRPRRQTGYPPARRYRGQTQTQYIAFNKDGAGDKSGVAEAVASPDLSRATVSEYQLPV